MRKLAFTTAIAALLTIITPSCSPVSEIQKTRLKDPNMDLSNRGIEEFESNFQSYREGAVGGDNGNGGAGCGCN